MKQITPKDLENPALKSGYTCVEVAPAPGPRGGGGSRRFRGSKRIKGGRRADGAFWRGSRRATAKEAAQDLCDFLNGNTTAPAPKLKSAGHKAPKRTPRTPTDSAAARKLAKLRQQCRELEAVVRKESSGGKGHVYCIGEEPSQPGIGSRVLNGVHFSNAAVKVGYAAKSPQQRLRELQTGNPRKLLLIGSFPGTLADEARLHQEFIHQNVLQEWFKPTPALLSRFTKRSVA